MSDSNGFLFSSDLQEKFGAYSKLTKWPMH